MTGRPLVLLLSGPNLNLLGEREPEIYGATTLEEIDAALAHASIGLALGTAVGIIGLWLTRFEFDEGHAGRLVYTPNRWLVLALTGVVALRIGYGLLRGWQWSRGEGDATEWLAQQGNLLAVGGLLLGHYLAYAWGLRQRLPRGPGVRRVQ